MTATAPKSTRTPEDADRRFAELGGDESVIPKGLYCYRITGAPRLREGAEFPSLPIEPCPYWGANPDKGAQEYGYCALLKAGDWEEDGTMLLWDQCKECGINDEIDEDDLVTVPDPDLAHDLAPDVAHGGAEQ